MADNQTKLPSGYTEFSVAKNKEIENKVYKAQIVAFNKAEYNHAKTMCENAGGKPSEYTVTVIDSNGNQIKSDYFTVSELTDPKATLLSHAQGISSEADTNTSNKQVTDAMNGKNAFATDGKYDFGEKSGTAGSGEYNFFKLFKLDETNISGFGFMPIYLASSSWNPDTGTSEEAHDQQDVASANNSTLGNGGIRYFKFILPMPAETDLHDRIGTGLKVNTKMINAAGRATASFFGMSGLGELMGKVADESNYANSLAVQKMLLAQKLANGHSGFWDQAFIDYNPTDISRSLTIPFTLPITETLADSDINEQWYNNVKIYLGALMGQLYPSGTAFIVPRLFRLRLGNLYRGFKGYITDVDITFSKDQVTTNSGFVVPITITGNITFKCVALYSWNDGCNVGDYVLGDKDDSPRKIFGTELPSLKSTTTAGSFATNDYTDKKTTEELTKEVLESIKTENYDTEILTVNEALVTAKEDLDEKSENIENETKEYSEPIIEDKTVTSQELQDKGVTTGVLDGIANVINGAIGGLGKIIGIPLSAITGLEKSGGIGSTLLSTIFKNGKFNVTNIANYVQLFNSIKNGDVSTILNTLPGVLNNFSKSLGTATGNLNETYRNVNDVLETSKNINVNNIANLASSLNQLLITLNKLTGK